jgi:hypothetical protein
MSIRKHHTPEQIDAFAKAIEGGTSLLQALQEHLGYSEKTARLGQAAMSQTVRSALIKRGLKFTKIGEEITAQEQENFVRGKLLSNAIAGKDKAVNSLKLLGQDKRVNMFTPDSIAGIIVIEAPKSLPTIPYLDASGH